MAAFDRVEELDVLLVDEARLRVVECLPLEAAILNVQDAVSVALHVRVVCDHDARGALCLVDVEEQVHDLHCVLRVQVARRLVQ